MSVRGASGAGERAETENLGGHVDPHGSPAVAKASPRAGSLLGALLPGLLSLAMVLAALPSAVSAQSGGAPSAAQADAMKAMMDEQLARLPSGEEGVGRIMGELSQRLELTSKQQSEIRPIVSDSVSQMEKIRDRYQAGEINAMALGIQLQMAGQKAATKVEPYLDDAQKVTYAEMRQEQRREMMKAMQQARALAPAPAGDGAQ